MKRNELLERRKKNVPPEIKASVDMSFSIVDRICDILEAKGWKQKDLAERMGKTEAEISRWMRGTHNFTLDTIAAIQTALGERIIDVTSSNARQSISATPILLITPKETPYSDVPSGYTRIDTDKKETIFLN